MSLVAGTIIDRYVVERPLGRGGMARVYLVRHRTLGTHYALKILDVRGPVFRARMLLEGQVQATLQHPNIVWVADTFDFEDSPCLLMQYVDGPNLHDWLQSTPRDLTRDLSVYRGIIRGIRYAHFRGITHRDLKPANILLAKRENGIVIPCVCDFGVAKAAMPEGGVGEFHTRTGSAIGTPEYQAPEQIRDAAHVDHRADLFSLGAILYEIACRQRAFDGPDVFEIYKAITSGRYVHPYQIEPSLPVPVVETIERLLQVDPSRRYQNCQEVLESLDRMRPTREAGVSSTTSAPPPPPVPSRAAGSRSSSESGGLAMMDRTPASNDVSARPGRFNAITLTFGLMLTTLFLEILRLAFG